MFVYRNRVLTILSDVHRLNLEFCRAADVMSHPVESIHVKETVSRLAQLLLTSSQSGFPVVGVENADGETETVYGLLSR